MNQRRNKMSKSSVVAVAVLFVSALAFSSSARADGLSCHNFQPGCVDFAAIPGLDKVNFIQPNGQQLLEESSVVDWALAGNGDCCIGTTVSRFRVTIFEQVGFEQFLKDSYFVKVVNEQWVAYGEPTVKLITEPTTSLDGLDALLTQSLENRGSVCTPDESVGGGFFGVPFVNGNIEFGTVCNKQGRGVFGGGGDGGDGGPANVPEPETLVLLSASLVGLIVWRSHRLAAAR
jgi:hypothetical protein